MASRIDHAIQKIINDCYERALSVLKDHRKLMDNMVKALFEKETIFKADVDRLFAEEAADSAL